MRLFIFLSLLPLLLCDPISLRLHRLNDVSPRLFSVAHRPWAAKLRPSTTAVTAPRPRLNRSAEEPHQPFFGDIVSVGEYYVSLAFGGQPINVQIDTGSSTIAVPLRECKSCAVNDHRFDIAAASNAQFISCRSRYCTPRTCSFYSQCSKCSSAQACCSSEQPSSCGFFLSYADQSGVSGALVEAPVTIAGLTLPQVFGVILTETSDFERPPVDGILGMAYWPLACNPTCVKPLFDNLVENKLVQQDVFSMCSRSNGGMLTLGGSNREHYEGELQYVSMRHQGNPLYYDVAVETVKINDVKIKVKTFSSAIVDSGTTLLIMTAKAYKAFRKYFQSNYCHVPGLCPGKAALPPSHIIRVPGSIAHEEAHLANMSHASSNSWFTPGYCVRLTPAQVHMLPPIDIVLEGGVALRLEPEDYMLEYQQANALGPATIFRCLGFSYLEALEMFDNNVILGNTVLQKYFVEYDRANDRIGFAVAKDCVDPDAEPLEGNEIPYKSQSWIPSWLITGVLLVAVIVWILIIIRCAGDMLTRHRELQGYNEIASTS